MLSHLVPERALSLREDSGWVEEVKRVQMVAPVDGDDRPDHVACATFACQEQESAHEVDSRIAPPTKRSQKSSRNSFPSVASKSPQHATIHQVASRQKDVKRAIGSRSLHKF